MKQGHLSQYFTGVAAKQLSAVEAHPHRSNQHEFDGVATLRNILGPANERKQFSARFVYLNDDDPEPIVADGFLTWYDARKNHPTRSEYRLYFPTTMVSQNASEGDLLVIARRPDDSVLVVIAEAGSTIANQVQWLFGLSDLAHPGFSVKGELESHQVKLEFASRFILGQIGIQVDETDEDYLEAMLTRFGGSFPTTHEFSAYARETLPEVTAADDPDATAMAWIDREEVLFRTLEKHIIADRLRQGFKDVEVDAFMSYAQAAQNRRKKRAGSALENHLEFLFLEHGIRYARGALTEGRSRPDFLFPGAKEYHDSRFDALQLDMLGVKSTCKDRWRQILAEADRVPLKHLLTLEPGISESQTAEMKQKHVQLVLPASIHPTYSSGQRKWLMNVAGFLRHVKEKQQSS